MKKIISILIRGESFGCLGKIFLKAEAASLLENPVSSTSR